MARGLCFFERNAQSFGPADILQIQIKAKKSPKHNMLEATA
jgi:hypothetical protein